MAKPVTGALSYNPSLDRPTVFLQSGEKRLLTEDDSSGGSLTSVASTSDAIVVTDPTGPAVSLAFDVSALENGGSEELDVGGLSGELADPQRADTLVVSGPTDLAIGSVTDGQFLVRSGSTVVGADNFTADVRSLIVARPSSAHADNDEFESTSLGGAWGWYKATATNVVMTAWSSSPPTATDLTQHTAQDAYRLHTDRRRSWLQWQSAEGGDFKGLFRACSPSTDMCLHTMVSLPYVYDGSATNNAMFFRFVVCADSGGLPDLGNSLQLGVDHDGSSVYYLRCGEAIGGAAVATIPTGGSATSFTSTRFDIPYFGFRKRGSSISHYAGAEGFHIRFGPEKTFSPTIAWVGYLYFTAAATGEYPLWGVNWYRRQNDLLALPW